MVSFRPATAGRCRGQRGAGADGGVGIGYGLGMGQVNGATHRLTDSVDLGTLQEMQDAFAALGRVSMSICDADGRPVTRPSCNAPLCSLINTSGSGQAACAQSAEQTARAEAESSGELGRAGAESSGPSGRGGAGQTCHAGLPHIRVPIEFDGRQVGAIVVGDRPASPIGAEQVRQLAEAHKLDASALAAAAEQLGPWSKAKRQATINCAELLAKTLARMCRQDLLIRDRVEELSAVYTLAGLLSGTKDLQDILEQIARQVADVMHVKACSIRLLDESTGELVMQAVHNLSAEYRNKGPVVIGQNPIDDATLAGETVYIADTATDPRTRYPEEARREGIVSGLCAPLAHRGQTVGLIRVYSGEPHHFSLFEVSLLRAVAAQAAAAIVNARLHTQREESARYHRQMAYAGEIQRRMMPARPPKHKNLAFGAVYAPTLEVGGDFYDFIDLPWGNQGLCVADVVGKGLPAALMMASVRAALRGLAHSVLDVNEIIERVNRHLYRDTLSDEFASLFYGVFSPDGGQITYCNAGHNPPLLLRGDEFTPLETGGLVIGVSPNETFARDVLHLRPKDVLVFYTDGVTEAVNFQGESFGVERLRASMLRYRAEPAPVMAKQVLWDVRRFAGLAPQADDLTVVVAKVSS